MTLPRGLRVSLPVSSLGALPRKLGICLQPGLSAGPASACGDASPKQSLKRPLGALSPSATTAQPPRLYPAAYDLSSSSSGGLRLGALSAWRGVGSSGSAQSSGSQCSSGSGSPPHGGGGGGGDSSGEEGPAPSGNSGGAHGQSGDRHRSNSGAAGSALAAIVDPAAAPSSPPEPPPLTPEALALADSAACAVLRWDAEGPHFWASVRPGAPPQRLPAAGLLCPQHTESATPEAFLAQLLAHGHRSPARAPASDAEAGPGESGGGPVYRRKPTAKMVADYDLELVAAVRQRDFGTLRRLHAQGRSLDACNKYGESVMHAACRRGDLVLARLLLELGATPLAVDDFGRTPLHDACWAPEPCLDLVRLLLAADPRAVWLRDSRGAGPLAYARKEHHGVWCAFLDHVKDELFPRTPLGVAAAGSANVSQPGVARALSEEAGLSGEGMEVGGDPRDGGRARKRQAPSRYN